MKIDRTLRLVGAMMLGLVGAMMLGALTACGGSVAGDSMATQGVSQEAARTDVLASGADVCPVQLALAFGSVVWTNRCAETAPAVRASVRAVSTTGGEVRDLWRASSTSDIDVDVHALTSDGEHLYFSVANSVYVTDATGANVPRAYVLPKDHDVEWLALDGTHVCASVTIAASSESALDTIDTANASPADTLLTAPSPVTYGVVANNGGVFWSNGSLVSLDNAMHASEIAISSSRSLAADPDGDFFVVRADTASLVRISNGALSEIAPARIDSDIAVDDASIYYTAGATVMRITKPNGTPTLFATGASPHTLVVDDSRLYWIDGNSVVSAAK